jgi:hypothetical protein
MPTDDLMGIYKILFIIYLAIIRETFKGRFPLMFAYEPNITTEGAVTDNNFQNPRKTIINPSRPISLKSQIVIDDERITVRYCKTRKYNEKKDMYENRPKNLPFKGSLAVNKNEMDLAVFMLYLQRNVNNGLEASEIEIVRPYNGQKTYYYRFVDDQKIAANTIREGKDESITKNLIYYEMSNEAAKSLALMYYVDNADTLNEDQIRVALFAKIVGLAQKSASYENIFGLFAAKYEGLTGVKNPVDPKTDGDKQEGKHDDEQPDLTNIESGADRELRIKEFITKAVESDSIMAFGLNAQNASQRKWMTRKVDSQRTDAVLCLIEHENPTDSLYKAILNDENLMSIIKTRMEERQKAKQE